MADDDKLFSELFCRRLVMDKEIFLPSMIGLNGLK